MIVTAIVVKDGDNYTDEMFVMGEGLKTSTEMKKYKQVNYQPGLYYDKSSGEIVDRDAQLHRQLYKDALQTKIKEEILNQNHFTRVLRRGR